MAVVLCALVAVCYWLGGRRPVRLVDAPRRWNGRHWRATAFFAGLGMIAIGLSGPGDAVARASMATRTGQLVALLMVAAPLLVLGAPELRLRRLLQRSPRPLRRSLAMPILAFLLFNGGILIAFLPAVYRATAGPGWPRQLGQIAMVGLAYLFWSQAIDQPPAHCRLSHIGRVVYLFLSSAQLRVLGVVLGFASAAFYPVPLVDQQIAAGILMVPGVLTDLVVLTVCLYLWLGQDDRREMRHGDPGGRRRPALGQRTAVR
ncbi:MAG TPA: cytochrome c oxidase assembly protein [Candidatus Dormibacteraeota bacterium]|nr:cytochrome c oxidase assembly protein [Candidatus Dormibacteraeota bacterium]